MRMTIDQPTVTLTTIRDAQVDFGFPGPVFSAVLADQVKASQRPNLLPPRLASGAAPGEFAQPVTPAGMD